MELVCAYVLAKFLKAGNIKQNLSIFSWISNCASLGLHQNQNSHEDHLERYERRVRKIAMDLKHSWNSSGGKSEPLLIWRNKKRRWNYTGPTISGNSEETFSKGWHSNVALPARTQAGMETERINWLLTIFFQCINPTVPENKGST